MCNLMNLMNCLQKQRDCLGSRMLRYLIQNEGKYIHCGCLAYEADMPDTGYFEALLPELSDESALLSSCDLAFTQSNLQGAKRLSALDLAQCFSMHKLDDPMTDRKTLLEIGKRIKDLKQKLGRSKEEGAESKEEGAESKEEGAESMELSSEQAKAITEELKALYAYRQECLRPNGNIRCFPSGQRRLYQSCNKAIKRLLEKMDPPIRDFVTQHLKQGLYYAWLP